MLATGEMPEYLFRRTRGIVGLLRRLIEDGCAKASATGEEQHTPALRADTGQRECSANGGTAIADGRGMPPPHLRRRRPRLAEGS